jgi:magnesium-transporting ATPase (P-type)
MRIWKNKMTQSTQDPNNTIAWHSKSVKACLNALGTTLTGLHQTEAHKRQKQYGPNTLPTPAKRGLFVRFLMQFNHLLIYILIAAAFITILLHHFVDTVVILTVVLVNAVIGVIQEGKAEKAMDAMRDILAPMASVFRDGIRHSISSSKLVPGDVVFLEAGDKVPADLRLLQTHGLMLQEAILTGESVPVEKNIASVPPNTSVVDCSCMAFAGTLVTHGQGQGMVVATGFTTEMGRISSSLSQVKQLTTPLLVQMSKFAQWISVLILLISFLLFMYGYFIQHHPFTELFMIIVALSVAAIPEGLPAVLTITLAIGMQVMARHKAIVRRLPVIDTFGSVSVICTDKTGTLTQNEMMVVSVATHAHQFTVDGVDYAPDGDINLNKQRVNHETYPVLKEIARAATLCNDSELHHRNKSWVVEGDPMEGALLSFSNKAGLAPSEERRTWARTDAIPFDAKHCFMATLNHNHLNQAFVFIKGAPEHILKRCQKQKTEDGQLEALDRAYWEKTVENIAAKGQRILAFGIKPTCSEHTVLEFSELEDGLIFLGMVGLMDPPRPEVMQALIRCETAGIQVKMLTGDHARTAAAIGRQIGLKSPDRVLTGNDLEQMDDMALAGAVLKTNIFARTTPEQKLRLVMALQSHDMTVAMTGDGVNDAPALKRADAGIAMGKTGSDVAKESSDLVLADDNFTSIVSAVREGRTVYDNLKKVISWTLPTNAGEALIIIVALFFGMTLPISAIQILWINLITASTLGITLAFEPTEKNTMHRPPRPRTEPLLTGILAWHSIVVSVLFTCAVLSMYSYAIGRGYSVELARTIALNTLVVLEIFHLFFIRNIYGTSLTWDAIKGNKIVWSSVLIIMLAQFSITYLPFLQSIFHTEAISFFDGMLIFTLGVVFFAIIEIEKQVRLILEGKRLN